MGVSSELANENECELSRSGEKKQRMAKRTFVRDSNCRQDWMASGMPCNQRLTLQAVAMKRFCNSSIGI
jgi:hypothetical protein